jgi:NAD(P)-dependent dehydrogenase (short-subunit alcohol dehydrogenase family)
MIRNVSSGSGVTINIALTPAVERHKACILYSTQTGVFAIIEPIALKYANKNRAHNLVLGMISTEATFSSTVMSEMKKAARETPMNRQGDSKDFATIAAIVASKDYSFSTGNTTTVIDDGKVML